MFKLKNVSLYVVAGLFLLIAVNIVLAGDPNEAVVKKTSPDPFERNKRLGRGINLGNALEAPNEGEWGITLKEEYFKIIKDAGFDSVQDFFSFNCVLSCKSCLKKQIPIQFN